MKKQIVTKATGGWGFHFGVTKEQAEEILGASDGDIIKLNGDSETLSVGRSTMGHWKKLWNGATFEELVASNVRAKLYELIKQDDWGYEEE